MDKNLTISRTHVFTRVNDEGQELPTPNQTLAQKMHDAGLSSSLFYPWNDPSISPIGTKDLRRDAPSDGVETRPDGSTVAYTHIPVPGPDWLHNHKHMTDSEAVDRWGLLSPEITDFRNSLSEPEKQIFDNKMYIQMRASYLTSFDRDRPYSDEDRDVIAQCLADSVPPGPLDIPSEEYETREGSLAALTYLISHNSGEALDSLPSGYRELIGYSKPRDDPARLTNDYNTPQTDEAKEHLAHVILERLRTSR